MKRKSLIALLLFSFAFITSHDYLMQAVDHAEFSVYEKHGPSYKHHNVKNVHHVHDAIDNMVMHCSKTIKPKSYDLQLNALFDIPDQESLINPNLLERPPTA